MSSSDAEEFAPQILEFSVEEDGQKPFTRLKNTRDASKLTESEGEKPKTQVDNKEVQPKTQVNKPDYFKLRLFVGVKRVISYEKGISPIFFSYFTNGGIYLESLAWNGAKYLGRFAPEKANLNELSLLEENVKSLVKKLIPDLPRDKLKSVLIPLPS
ncbi:MAG: hypothetical protein KDK55_03415 [Chlamydiia bacterium]|nr:hypothetical protein [Chlamydiia bacterium]